MTETKQGMKEVLEKAKEKEMAENINVPNGTENMPTALSLEMVKSLLVKERISILKTIAEIQLLANDEFIKEIEIVQVPEESGLVTTNNEPVMVSLTPPEFVERLKADMETNSTHLKAVNSGVIPPEIIKAAQMQAMAQNVAQCGKEECACKNPTN